MGLYLEMNENVISCTCTNEIVLNLASLDLEQIVRGGDEDDDDNEGDHTGHKATQILFTPAQVAQEFELSLHILVISINTGHIYQYSFHYKYHSLTIHYEIKFVTGI
jgi:hypothetical protein